MIYAISIQQIDSSREDVYLASVQDQEAVIDDGHHFKGRTVLRSQVEEGTYWLIDAWTDEPAMQMALAAARTLATVAALVEVPKQLLADGEELARRTRVAVGGPAAEPPPPFFLIGENWVKEFCVGDYRAEVLVRGRGLLEEPGFTRRLMLIDRERAHHYWVIDEWASERDAYESYERRVTPEIEATRFLSFLAERVKPILATGLQVGA